MTLSSKSKRNPLLALTASMFLPGLGQFYNGEISKGISLFLCFAFAVPIAASLALLLPDWALSFIVISGVLFALGIYLIALVDSYVRAKQIAYNPNLAAYHQPYTYISVLFFGYFFILGQLNEFTK